MRREAGLRISQKLRDWDCFCIKRGYINIAWLITEAAFQNLSNCAESHSSVKYLIGQRCSITHIDWDNARLWEVP